MVRIFGPVVNKTPLARTLLSQNKANNERLISNMSFCKPGLSLKSRRTSAANMTRDMSPPASGMTFYESHKEEKQVEK